MASRADLEKGLYQEQASGRFGPPAPKNVYSSARSRPKAKPAARSAAVPAPNPAPAQPSFPEATISLDPFDQSQLGMPAELIGLAPMGRGPGAQDIRATKFAQDQSRGKSLNVYQDAGEYEKHLETVMGSGLMKDLAAGAERFKGLREDFLRNAPQQTDLSPTMALADYLAKSKGTASAGYKRPGSYEDMVKQLGNLMGDEQGARQNVAQLAFQQSGGLKSGEEQAQFKTGVDRERQQGYKTPQPRSQFPGGGNPLNQALAIQRAFQGLPPYKEAEGVLANAQSMLKALQNPSWISDQALRGQVLQGMKLSPISEKELAEFGRGSPELINRIKNMFTTVSSGRTLSPQDYKALEEFALRSSEYATHKMDIVQSKFAEGLGPYAIGVGGSSGIKGITNPSISPPLPKQDQGPNPADDKFNKFLEKF